MKNIIKKFEYFKSLGDDLYFGSSDDHFGEGYNPEITNYEGEVRKFFKMLSWDDKIQLMEWDAAFYFSLYGFYKSLDTKNHE